MGGTKSGDAAAAECEARQASAVSRWFAHWLETGGIGANSNFRPSTAMSDLLEDQELVRTSTAHLQHLQSLRGDLGGPSTATSVEMEDLDALSRPSTAQVQRDVPSLASDLVPGGAIGTLDGGDDSDSNSDEHLQHKQAA